MLQRGHGILQVGQAAPGGLFRPFGGIAVAVEDHGHVFAEQTGQQILQGVVQFLSAFHGGFQLGGDIVQGAGHGAVQGDIGRSDGLGGAYGPELELVAGKGEGTGTVAIRVVARQGRQRGNADLHGRGSGVRGLFPDDAQQGFFQQIAEIHGNNRGRGFIGAEAVIVAGSDGAETQGHGVFVYGAQYGGEKDQKAGVGARGIAGIEQIPAVGGTQGPVVVLAAAVHARKGLFVQQADEAMIRGHMAQHVHYEHVVVGGDVDFLMQGGHFKLARSHFVVAGAHRNAQSDEPVFHILHERHDAPGHRAEIVIFHFLPLWGGKAAQGRSGHEQIRAQRGKTAIHEKVFLLRADHGADVGGIMVAEQAQHAQSLPGNGLNGAQQRRLAIQRFAGPGIENGGNMQGIAAPAGQDEDRHGGVPGGIAARLERGTDAAGREGGGVGLPAYQHLAGKLLNGVPVSGGGKESIVLFRRDAGHGLEPVRVVRCPALQRPVADGAGHDIGDVRRHGSAAADGLFHLPVCVARQTFAHGVQIEHVTAEQTLHVNGRPQRGRTGRLFGGVVGKNIANGFLAW